MLLLFYCQGYKLMGAVYIFINIVVQIISYRGNWREMFAIVQV